MALSIACTGCGSTLKVRDELLGKRIKCPKCGAGFTVAEASKQARVKENAGGIGHRVHIPGNVIALVLFILLVPGGFLFWKLGPGKVRAQFEENLPKMDDNVKDVMTRALEAYTSQHEHFNPLRPHAAPQTFLVNYKLGYMPITMPTELPIGGLTSEGAFVGQYNTQTNEVTADMEVGGQANSVILLRHGPTIVHVVGHMNGGDVVATIDGQPAVVKFPDMPVKK